ncbi:MAG: copper-binding protein [Verrucomicrobia bacterium]|nr:copper-binding protein [Verrucomicrobiota bacterium]
MKTTRLLPLLPLAVATLFAAQGKNCGCDCCQDRPKGVACCCFEATPAAPVGAAANDGIKRHDLRGVVTNIYADRSALLVRHEEIPGFMKPMTMLFKVDAPTLQAARKGQTITARMSRQGNDWVLEDVKVVAQP